MTAHAGRIRYGSARYITVWSYVTGGAGLRVMRSRYIDGIELILETTAMSMT